MKKYILTETQLKKLIDGMISEEVTTNGKLHFAFDGEVTDFQGVIGKDGYLYPYTEMFETWKVGPISKVPYTGDVFVQIDKRGGKEVIYVIGGKSSQRGKLEMNPNFTVEEVDYKSIPK